MAMNAGRNGYGEEQDVMHEYALVPLKNVVVFPKIRVNLTITRPRSVRAVLDADKSTRVLVVVTQRHPDLEDPRPDDLNEVAMLVDLLSVNPQNDGSVVALVEGNKRVHIEGWLGQDPYPRVAVTRIIEPAPTSKSAESLVRHAHELFEHFIPYNHKFTPDDISQIQVIHSCSRLADSLAAHIVTDSHRQQELLETIDPEKRLEKVCVILGNEIEVQVLDQRIRQRVRDQVDRNQQEYYLKEQIRAIMKELGNDSATEIMEMRERIRTLGMPETIMFKVLKELDKLERLPATSAEINVLRNYIDMMMALPWQERTQDQLDLKAAKKLLDVEHYGLANIKDRVLDFLAVRQLRSRRAQQLARETGTEDGQSTANQAANRGPILCFIGPPGVGKTSLGASIARAMGRKFFRISLGGVHDEAEIRGHRRTYIGALPGRIIQAMRSVGVKNPVFLLDEVDKLASDYRGDPAAALLEVLDPEQNNTFTDHYLEAPFDLSEVFFICTANARYQIPRALADRMEIVEIAGYTLEEKAAIGRRHLWPKVLKEAGYATDQITLTDRALRYIIESYTHEAGVRSLERQLAAICLKIARPVYLNPGLHKRITPHQVEEYLGVPRYLGDRALDHDQIGVATGMAWTESGGTLLRVEVAVMTGRGSIRLTGQQGDVMQESAHTAHSYIRTRAEALGIPANFADQYDMHIHLPEGAIPKDGPSAGITIAAAMISALTERPIRADTAMTGEITLRGNVFPIGGLKEKVLAAHRVGIRRIILPADNRKDVSEIPEPIRRAMQFIYVRRMEEVEAAILRDAVEDTDGQSIQLIAQGGDRDEDKPIPPNVDRRDGGDQENHNRTPPTPPEPPNLPEVPTARPPRQARKPS